MTSSRLNFAMVGGFVLAALVSLVVGLALLAGRTGATDTYYTSYGNVAGLKFGSQVLFEGYPVGQVERIEPRQDGTRTTFRIELSIQRGWKIPADSIARPVAPGVLAAQTVSIAGGKSDALLRPGDTIQPAESVDLLASLSTAAGTVDQITNTTLVPMLENLDRQITLLGGILDRDVRPLAHDLNAIISVTAQRWPDIARRADDASAHLATASQKLDDLLSPQRVEAVDHLLVDVDQTAASLRSASEHIDALARSDDVLGSLQDLRYLMATFARYSGPVGENIDVSARNFREFSRQVRQNPGVILRSGVPDEDPVPPLRQQPASP